MYEAIETLRGLLNATTLITSIEITNEYIITTDILGEKEYFKDSVQFIDFIEDKSRHNGRNKIKVL